MPQASRRSSTGGASGARIALALAGALLAAGAASAAAGPGGAGPGIDGPDGAGVLRGVVTDDAGAPLASVLVTAAGPGGAAMAHGDAEGAFTFHGLAPGRYLLRAHRPGFHTPRVVVDVQAGSATVLAALRLRRADSGRPAARIRLAGFGLGLPPPQADDEPIAAAAADADGEAAPDPEADGGGEASLWRLRRVRRSVLKSRTWELARNAGTEPERLDMALGRGPLTDFVRGLPVSGEVRFLARATLDGPLRWRSATGVPPGQVAYFAVAPASEDAAQWAVRGALNMTTGNASAWAVAGRFAGQPHEDHDLDLRLSYSRQQYATASGRPAPPLGADGSGRPSREVVNVRAFDTWAPSPHLTVSAGADLAGYGYLEDGRLFSPQAQLTLAGPSRRTRIRVGLSRRMTAPGAEQFLPPGGSGVWLPPERTFTSLSGLDPLRTERTRHIEVAVERDLGGASTLEVRRFRQDVAGQLVTLFGAVGAPLAEVYASPGGHYRLASLSGAAAGGWAVGFRHDDGGRLRSAVDYTVLHTEWAPGAALGGSLPGRVARAGGAERLHDVTTTVEAEVPETATRVFAVCRINTAFARLEDAALTSGVGARFDVRVTQRLPFSPFGDSTWELLVALRSLFHDPAFGASVHDELLVVDPPPQFVGGLVVHF